MSRSILIFFIILSACHSSTRERNLWHLSAYSNECRTSPAFKVYMLGLNHCKSESFNENGFKNCVDKATSGRNQLSKSCQEQTLEISVQSSAFFLNQVLDLDVESEKTPQDKKLQKASDFLSYWLTKLPENADLKTVEVLFNRFYSRVIAIYQKSGLNKETIGNPNHDIMHSVEFFKNAVGEKVSSGFHDLLVLNSYLDLLRSIEPKLKLILSLKSSLCEYQPCIPENIPEFGIFDLVLDNNPPSLGMSGHGSLSTVLKVLANSSQNLLQAKELYVSRNQNYPEFKNRIYENSRLNELIQTINSWTVLRQQFRAIFTNTRTGQENLKYGLSRENFASISEYLSEKSNQLLNEKTDRTIGRSKLFQLWLQDLNVESELVKDYSQYDLDQKDIERLEIEIQAIQNAYVNAKVEYANQVKKYSRDDLEFSGLASHWNSEIIADNATVLSSDAKYRSKELETSHSDLTEEQVINLSDISTMDFDLEASQALSIDIDGEWGPNCAIKKEWPEKNVNQLVTGPNGYVEIRSSTNSRIESREKYQRFTSQNYISNTGNLCINNSIPFIGGNGPLASDCNSNGSNSGSEKGSNFSTVDSQSDSTSLNLQGGLTLKDTPFPNLPAGALIAVVSSSEGNDYHVLNRSNMIHARDHSKVFLIVNDCDEQSGSSNHSLTLRVHRLSSAEQSIKNTVVEAHEKLESKFKEASQILKQGYQIEEEVQKLVKEVETEIYLEHGAVLNQFEIARKFIELFITHHTNQLIRQAKIYEKSLNLTSLKLQNQTRNQTIKLGLSRKEVLNLEAKEVFDDLSLSEIGPQLYEINNHLVRQIYPVIFFYVSHSDLESFTKVAVSHLSEKLSFDTSLDDMMNSYAKYLSSLATALSQTNEYVRYQNQFDDLVISVPNPHLKTDKRQKRGMPVLDGPVGLKIWQSFFGTQAQDLDDQVFRLDPKVVYGNHFAEGGISCYARQLVIEDLAFAFVSDSKKLTRDYLKLKSRNKDFPVRIGPDFTYISENGPITFQVQSSSEGISNARFAMVRSDAHEDAYDILLDSKSIGSSGKGLSPFTNWSFNSSPIRTFVKLNPSLFYNEDKKGTLSFEKGKDPDLFEASQEYFKDDFFDLEQSKNTNGESLFDQVDIFPSKISEILILVRFSSLNKTGESQMSWLPNCR